MPVPSKFLTHFKLPAACALVATAAACGPVAPIGSAPTAVPAARPGHVVVISIDGLRPDAIQGSNALHLQQMIAEGAWTLDARTILPSKTLPSHTSMLTGVPPAIHGITWNEWESERGLVRVPTLFDVAEARGLRTAAFFGKAKFRHLIRDAAPHWRRAPRGEVWNAARVTQDVEQFLRYNQEPDLVFVHLADPDLAGHVFGWMSLPYRQAVRRADAAVGRLVHAARRAWGDDFVVIVTADHGGHGHGHGSEASEDQQIPWIAWGRGIAPGEITADVHTFDTAATALWLLGVEVPSEWAGRPVAGPFASYALKRIEGRPGARAAEASPH